MDWRKELHGKEAAHYKGKFQRTVKLCKAIWQYRDYVELIKGRLDREDPVAASQLWNELDYEVQKLLITAPLFGGPFTTEEVKKIKELWEITADDLDN